MRKHILVIITLLTFWVSGILIQSCGSKDSNTQKTDTTKSEQKQITETQQQNTKTDESKNKEEQKEEEKLKEQKKKEEDEKKKKEEQMKKENEQKKEEEKRKTDESDPSKNQKTDFSAIWSKKCAKCHGKNGKGKVEGVPDLTSSDTKSKSDNELKKIIENGKKGKTEDDEDMPSFKGKLTPEEIQAAVKYVKSL